MELIGGVEEVIVQFMDESSGGVERIAAERKVEVATVLPLKWSVEQTKLLLKLYNDLIDQVGKSPKLKNKKMMWKKISVEMSARGYSVTPLQAENRYKTLDRGYKRKSQNNNKTRRDLAFCEFESELSDIKRKSLVPNCVLGIEEEKTGETRSNRRVQARRIVTEPLSTSPEPLSASPPPSNSSPGSPAPTDSAPSELQYFKAFKEKELALREEELLLERARLVAYGQRTEAIVEKNSLFKEFLEIYRAKTI